VASRALAFSNLFGVATGNEPASVMQGWIAAKTTLNARRGTFKTPYRGPVYILDAVTNNPGAAGGALTNRRGELLGVLGKELRNRLTTTWLNYALPAAEVRRSVKDILSDTIRSVADEDRERPDKPLSLAALGIMLVPDVIQRTPSYVDAIHRGSAAETVGLRRDDLVVMLNGRTVTSQRALGDELSYLEQDSRIVLTVVRDSELLDVSLQLQSDAEPTDDAAAE
jgi:S1-C subfamily serine protease